MDEDQARPDPRESGMALAGTDPELTHDEFMANLYPKVQESLKFLADEHVILEDPLNEPRKLNVEAEVVSMVTVPIFQASFSVPPLSTPVIDLSPPKPASSTTQAPIFTATTTTTTTTLPPPPQQQSIIESELAKRVTALENKFSNLEKKNKNLNNMTRNLRSRVFTLKLRDLPHKIDETVCDIVKEAVQSGSYKSLPEHVALYEALEASMKRAQRDEFFAEKDKLIIASSSSVICLKTTDIREAPSSSSKQQYSPHVEQPVEDIPMPDTANIYDSEDTDSAHLPKIKQRPKWFKPVPEEDRPSTPEPDWSIPTNDLLTREQLGKHLPNPIKIPRKTSYFKRLMEECHQVDLVNPDGHRLVPDISKPLPLGGPLGRKLALSISKLKATQYLDFRLEELVLSLWIKSEHEYDISDVYVNLKTLERYGYAYLKEIVLRRADYKEYKISEADFKNLHPNDFEYLYLLHLQETEVHKFSDGTLNRIMDKLDHMVKDFKLYEYNLGMATQIWYEDDRRRSKDFMEVIKRRLKVRRIFRSLKSFVGGRLRDFDYRLIQRTE
ncbi:hypothetical protein Tco_0807810 [Tanacetum coccineum]